LLGLCAASVRAEPAQPIFTITLRTRRWSKGDANRRSS
jgi:hypothetical protein